MHFPYLCRKCRASNSIAWVIFCCASFTSRHPFRYMSVGGQRASMPTFAVADISRKAYGYHANRCGNFRQVNTTVCARDTSLLTRVRHRLQPPVDRTRRAEDDDDLQNRKSDSAWLSKCRCVLRASCRQR